MTEAIDGTVEMQDVVCSHQIALDLLAKSVKGTAMFGTRKSTCLSCADAMIVVGPHTGLSGFHRRVVSS